MSNKTKISILIINIILAIFIVVLDILQCFASSDYICKQIASINICVLALLNLLINIIFCKRKNLIVCLFIFLGVVIGSLGDLLIGANFILGGILFAVGHLLYIVALYFLSKFTWKEIVVAILVIAISMVVIFVPYINYGNYLILIVSYAIILSFMLSKCVSNFLFNKKNSLNIVLFIAGLLFYFSDMMLLLYAFKGADYIFDQLCLLMYLPAQIMFAFSIFVASQNNKNKIAKN